MSETTGCDYQGYEFGGGYLDSVCIDGYLWDADSCDEPGGGLQHGGEMACPQCNAEQFLADALRDAKDGTCGLVQGYYAHVSAQTFERQVAHAMRLNPTATESFLASLEEFETIDWPDRAAVAANPSLWDNTIDVIVTADKLRAALASPTRILNEGE